MKLKEDEKKPVLVRVPQGLFNWCVQEIAAVMKARNQTLSVPMFIVENLVLVREMRARMTKTGMTDNEKLAAWDELTALITTERKSE